MDGMDAREALLKIAWMHRGILNDNDDLVCAACSSWDDEWYSEDFPCDTRRVCEAALYGLVELPTADPWPGVLPGTPA